MGFIAQSDKEVALSTLMSPLINIERNTSLCTVYPNHWEVWNFLFLPMATNLLVYVFPHVLFFNL